MHVNVVKTRGYKTCEEKKKKTHETEKKEDQYLFAPGREATTFGGEEGVDGF